MLSPATIPDDDTLYCRVHVVNTYRKIDTYELMIKPQAFDPTPFKDPDGLSVNWGRYSDAVKTQNEVTANNKDPLDYGVVSFIVGAVREIPLRVIHAPVLNNDAHSLILDIPPRAQNDASRTMKLRDRAIWVIQTNLK